MRSKNAEKVKKKNREEKVMEIRIPDPHKHFCIWYELMTKVWL